MMSLSRRRAQAKAIELLERFHIRSPGDLAIEDLAFALGARVERGPLEGAMARLVGFHSRMPEQREIGRASCRERE